MSNENSVIDDLRRSMAAAQQRAAEAEREIVELRKRDDEREAMMADFMADISDLKAARAEALEEAARLCEQNAGRANEAFNPLLAIATMIRALKDKSDG